MIAIDTNVLLRYLLNDDEGQAAKAAKLIKGVEPVLIPDAVLVETLWTLKGKRYGLDREALCNVVDSLFQELNVVFENGQVVWCALNDIRKAKPIKSGGKRKEPDFADALIINKSRVFATENKAEFKGLYTFDIVAQQINGAMKP